MPTARRPRAQGEWGHCPECLCARGMAPRPWRGGSGKRKTQQRGREDSCLQAFQSNCPPRSRGLAVCPAPGSGWSTLEFPWQLGAFPGWSCTQGRGHPEMWPSRLETPRLFRPFPVRTRGWHNPLCRESAGCIGQSGGPDGKRSLSENLSVGETPSNPEALTFPPPRRLLIHLVTQVHTQEPSLTCPAPHPPTRPASSRASGQLHARPVCFSPPRPLLSRPEPPAALAWAPRSLLTGPRRHLGSLAGP